ncbi:hypothetical protein MRX96_040922 [Rhipicephalus microplus]
MASHLAYLSACDRRRKNSELACSLTSLRERPFQTTGIGAEHRSSSSVEAGQGKLQDYRPRTVTSTMYTLFTHVLKDWISDWAEP